MVDVYDKIYIFDEIESWSEKKRIELLVRLLTREVTHGDHSRELKNSLYAAVSGMRIEKLEE